ncbi:hypothetical protein LCGC14_3139720, partial [marine sediment metagenome]
MTAIASYHDKSEWLKERQTGIGGSDAAAILGLSPYRSPLDVWQEKTGPVFELEDTPAMKRGRVLEPVAAEAYVEETGCKIRRQPLRRHRELNFMISNVDRQVLAGTAGVDSPGTLEIKCPGLKVLADVKAHGLVDYMTVQLMHYLAVTGYDWGSFALFNAENWELIHFDLEADQDFIGMMMEKEADFWNSYVVPQVSPPEEVDAVEVPEVEGELKIMEGPDWLKAARDLQEAKELQDAAKTLADQAKDRVQELMKDISADAIELTDIGRFYYRTQDGRTSWKGTAQALAKESGLDLGTFEKVGKPFRTFRSYFYRSGQG